MIAAIIVLYYCNYDKISRVIASLVNQVDFLILVKNDDSDFDAGGLGGREKIHLIDLMRNCGIAYAQNKGVEKARQLNADFLLFSDQDTVFPSDYCSLIKEKIRDFPSKTIYAPVFYNLTKRQLEPLSISMKEAVVPGDEKYIPVFHAISSGTVVSVKDFEIIGDYNEDLFIDYVDFEWCWKARAKGYRVLCFPDIKIAHELGDSYKTIFKKKITLRSNSRYYYIIRNGLILSEKSEYLTDLEKRQLRKKTIILSFGILMLNHHILNNLKMLAKAFKDYRLYMRLH